MVVEGGRIPVRVAGLREGDCEKEEEAAGVGVLDEGADGRERLGGTDGLGLEGGLALEGLHDVEEGEGHGGGGLAEDLGDRGRGALNPLPRETSQVALFTVPNWPSSRTFIHRHSGVWCA